MPDPIQRSPEVEAAEAAKFLAEAKAAEARATKDAAEARINTARATIHEISAEREQEGRKIELAEDYYQRLYRFTEPVNQASVSKTMRLLSAWSRTDPGCEIQVVFTSPGGDIVAGMAFFDFLRELSRQGHKIVTKALGMAASMAGILLQAGDKRIMAKESWLLIHQASFGTMGSYGEVADRVKWVEMVQERIIDIFADRANDLSYDDDEETVVRADHNDPVRTRIAIKRGWERRDWWIPSDKALEYGFVDEVE